MSAPDLKPCPICGCKAEFDYGAPMTSGQRIVKVRCSIGCVEQRIFHCNEDQAAIGWNGRTQPPAPASGSGDAGGELYMCIGKGGRYELLGPVVQAGALKECDMGPLVTYRDLNTGTVYVRFADDFARRMARVDGPSHAPSACQTPSAEAKSATSSATSVAKVELNTAALKPCLNEIKNSDARAWPRSCPRCGLARECPAGAVYTPKSPPLTP